MMRDIFQQHQVVQTLVDLEFGNSTQTIQVLAGSYAIIMDPDTSDEDVELFNAVLDNFTEEEMSEYEEIDMDEEDDSIREVHFINHPSPLDVLTEDEIILTIYGEPHLISYGWPVEARNLKPIYDDMEQTWRKDLKTKNVTQVESDDDDDYYDGYDECEYDEYQEDQDDLEF